MNIAKRHFPLRLIWTGAVTDLSGYASASRGYVRSLLAAGVDVALEPRTFELWKNSALVDEIMDRKLWSLTGKDRDAKLHIIHLTPDLYHEYNHAGRIKVGLFAWETNKIPTSWVNSINGILKEVWVPCTYIKQACIDSGVTVPIFVIPHAIPVVRDPGPLPEIAGIRKEDFNFYSIAQWSGRKYIDGLLRAYFEEFEKNDKVTMVLKTYRCGDDLNQKDLIRREISKLKRSIKGNKSPRILLIEQFLGDREMNALHAQCDCFATMTRAEGFGLPAFEAMAFGNSVIVPDFSAFEEFIPKDIGYFVDASKMVPVKDMRHISHLYTGDMTWSEPSIADCRKRMRQIFENQKEAKDKGLTGQNYVKETFSFKEIGRQMKSRIEMLYLDSLKRGRR